MNLPNVNIEVKTPFTLRQQQKLLEIPIRRTHIAEIGAYAL